MAYKLGENLGNRNNQNTDKTHCVRGHEFTEENTYTYPSGSKHKRACRTCKNSPSKKREQHLKAYGWTPERFDLVFAEQKGKCAICGVILTPTDGKRNGHMACADHAHGDVPMPRGILCAHCNLGIGNLKENINTFKSAMVYLEKWKEYK